MKGSELSITDRVNAELISRLYQRSITFFNGETLGSILFLTLLWHGLNHKYIFVWLGYNICIFLLNKSLGLIYYCRVAKNKPIDLILWHQLFIAAIFLSGTVWGFAGLLFPYVTNSMYIILIILLLLIVAGIANVELFQHKTAYLAFVTPIYLSLLVLAISYNVTLYTFIFIGILIYITATTVIAGKSADILNKALFLRYKHRELLEYLYQTGKDVTSLNRKLSAKIALRKKAEKLLLELATHDYLTKLPNRNAINYTLEQSFALSQRNKTLVALFFLDLDHFKEINDKYGHDVGDLLLIEFAKRLQSNVRKIDMIVRFGGDEFCIIFDDLRNEDEVKAIATKVINEIRRVFIINNHPIHLSASIGIGIYPNDSSDIDSLFKIADIALYWAKKAGRNTFKVFED